MHGNSSSQKMILGIEYAWYETIGCARKKGT